MADKKEKTKTPADKAKAEKQKLANKKRAENKAQAVERLATGTIEKKKGTPRMKTFYLEKVIPAMLSEGKSNANAVPKINKIVVNMGVSEAKDNIQALDAAREDLAAITGQHPEMRRAKKSISNFKLREKMPIGVRVTLRGDRMYEFFDRLVMTAVPRIRDFRGLPSKGFDGRGNYNLGLREHHIFSEVNLEKSPKALGMNITFVTSAKNDEDGKSLLGKMGVPFKKDSPEKG